MDIDKELEDILNDPLLEMTEKERSLFEIPEDMKKVIEKKRSKAMAIRTVPDPDFIS